MSERGARAGADVADLPLEQPAEPGGHHKPTTFSSASDLKRRNLLPMI